jgi:hypothetical protein
MTGGGLIDKDDRSGIVQKGDRSELIETHYRSGIVYKVTGVEEIHI